MAIPWRLRKRTPTAVGKGALGGVVLPDAQKSKENVTGFGLALLIHYYLSKGGQLTEEVFSDLEP